MKIYQKRIVALVMATLMTFGTFSTALAEAWGDFGFGMGPGAPMSSTSVIYDMQDDADLALIATAANDASADVPADDTAADGDSHKRLR
jgi:uncharacterized protein YycO